MKLDMVKIVLSGQVRFYHSAMLFVANRKKKFRGGKSDRLLVLPCHKVNLGLIQLQCGQCLRALASTTVKCSRKVVIESGM